MLAVQTVLSSSVELQLGSLYRDGVKAVWQFTVISFVGLTEKQSWWGCMAVKYSALEYMAATCLALEVTCFAADVTSSWSAGHTVLQRGLDDRQVADS